ncbi:MAG TPA: mucoidy inhibitor MuiA family protein [Candidatus Lokiarchaeia archaeon]|nr:mucoidy inhibitor MuiA family protein [Candidatus Lokiarchaeia archaeon]
MEEPTLSEPIILETKPERVVIFQEGAQVTREGKCNLEAGTCIVKIRGLSTSVDTQSIRVKGTGPGKILNMIVKRAYAQEEQPGKVRDILAQIKALQRESRLLDDTIAGKEISLAQYKQSIAGSTGKYALYAATGKTRYETFSELDETLTGKIEGMIDEIADLQRKKKDLAKKIEVCQKEIEKINVRQGTVESNEIELDLEATEADEFTFAASYVFKSSSQARWQPFYEMYLQEESTDCTLKMNSLVTNNTGEDWKDIKLSLSTANIRPVFVQESSPYILRAHKRAPVSPARPRAAAPAMAPSGAHTARAKMGKTKFAMGGMNKEEKEEDEVMAPEEAEPMEPDFDMETSIATEAEVHEGVGIQTYEIDGYVNVPNGKDSGPFFLKDFPLTAELELFWSSPQGIMVVARNVVENTGQVLLPGTMRTYIDEEFVGESQADFVRPFEKFKTGVRESKIIKIKKELVDRGRKKAGTVVKDKIVRHYGYSIKIDVLADLDAKFVVMDAIPTSDSTRISVNNISFSQDPDKNETGVITWNFDTKSMDKKTSIDYEFDVVYNKDVVITPPLP